MTSLTRADVEHRIFSLFNDIDWWHHEELASAFSTNAFFTFALSREAREQGRIQTAEGNEAIANLYRAAFASLSQTHHMISNLMLKIEDDRAEVSMHMRAYHKGKGAVDGMFEESLALAKATVRKAGDEALIERFDYTIMIVLGSTDTFTDVKYEQTA
jgi:predicted RNA-binding Zn ribbon-like protein